MDRTGYLYLKFKESLTDEQHQRFDHELSINEQKDRYIAWLEGEYYNKTEELQRYTGKT